MISHLELGNASFARNRKIKELIDEGHVCFAGNKKLRIYGTLHCSSGKRMKPENRVFFKTENEALENQYRPCGHCMRAAYLKWKGLR